MTFAMTPVQYGAMLLALSKAPHVRSLTRNDPNSGVLDADYGIFRFDYNGVGTLMVQVQSKRGIARFASDSTIESHLRDLLSSLEAA